MSRTAPSKARMNSRPMILRLPSGSVTPASASRNRLGGVDGDQVGAGRGDEVALHLLRARPRAAARGRRTHRSAGRRWRAAPARRPPRSPRRRTARRSRGRRRSARGPARSSASAMLPAVQSAPMPATSCRNRLSTCWPCGECMHLGVVLHAGEPARPVLERGDRRTGAGGHHLEALGRHGDRVAVAHPHRLRRRADPNAARRQTTFSSVRPYSLVPVCATVPPSACAIAWKP